ncbi:MAG TPA: hypothetical protein VNR68_03115 [Sphingomicrobium sp.]|nr:hypothetical protein [Sphingomicrobium sp.]
MKLATALLAASALAGAAAVAQPKGSAQPIANYWMDVSTTSGFGAGMGARPSMDQVMAMMRGGPGSVGHALDLRLASKIKPAGTGQADHFIPSGMTMGASLPLVTPLQAPPAPRADGLPSNFQQPKGRMLVYWGCGERVGAGQPMVIDFAKLAAGQVPAEMKAMASMAKIVSGPMTAPGFGKWPNDKDSRPVPPNSSLAGAHRIAGNYSPEIAFTLGAGQDFMAGLGLTDAGSTPAGAAQLRWQAVPDATGFALAMFGSNPSGDVIMWSSANKAGMTALDYVAPAEVKRLVTAGAVLPPSATQCLLPAEVAAASPMGMVTMIGYGPEVGFADSPKSPKWSVKVRYKTTASLMRGMQGMMGGASMDAAQPVQQAQPQLVKKKRRSLLGDIIQGATGIPVDR